jgi:hypothetical protein
MEAPSNAKQQNPGKQNQRNQSAPKGEKKPKDDVMISRNQTNNAKDMQRMQSNTRPDSAREHKLHQ